MIEYTERFFRGLDLWSLGVDEAFINGTVRGLKNYFLYSLSDECDKCPYSKLHELKPSNGSDDNVFKLDISRRLHFKVFDRNHGKYAFDNESSVCEFDENLGEFGVYDLTLYEGNTFSCALETAKEPVNIYFPFITIALIVVALWILYKVFEYGFKLLRRSQHIEPELTPASNESLKTVPRNARLSSLDTFRGIAISIMIFVNSGGGHYWWIEHATWNGLHVADLVFPWFLFIMGVCIPISLRSQLSRNTSRTEILKTVAIRSLKLFLIGLCLNSSRGPNMADLRWFGVLQRFGIAYFVVSVIHLYCYRDNVQYERPLAKHFSDVLRLWTHWLIVLTIVFVYLLIMFLVPAPGCPRGYFGPGGKHMFFQHPNCTGGITGYLDRAILGPRHLYQHPTARYVYDALPFDPEGPFGCLPTIFQVFLGLQCGIMLQTFTEPVARIKRLSAWGTLCGLLGGILCGFSKNDGWIPVNKNLWSVSYVLVTASLAFFLLLICYVLVDLKRYWSGKPFLFAGMNSIVLYIGHSVFHSMLPWHWKVGTMNTHFMLTLEALWNTVLWIGIAYVMYMKKVFYSI
ncbi:heparan-alpha-glucosaminide N-acetyltransferase [Uranotaenia lowii]|uniref:heparan-alpha-glucosaminide N-acetyltransferase n=1 Tax=Uranotaenia lowii TaxID=190385 RepID=UPI002479019D|nr:heparan-alpha-glucosaminide N-acetyltransferase [Uranotaenia lowii]